MVGGRGVVGNTTKVVFDSLSQDSFSQEYCEVVVVPTFVVVG